MSASLRGVLAALLLAVALVASGVASARPAPITVVVTDSGFKLSHARVRLGPVVFHVRNAGKQPYDFGIAGRKTGPIAPGHSATLSVGFTKPGRFRYASGTLQGVLTVERVTTVEVTEYEFGFKLSPQTVPAGKVVFVMRNTGGIVHNFDLIDVEVGPFLVSGQTAKMTVDLKPGDYMYVCSVKYHAAQGMQGTLTVK